MRALKTLSYQGVRHSFKNFNNKTQKGTQKRVFKHKFI